MDNSSHGSPQGADPQQVTPQTFMPLSEVVPTTLLPPNPAHQRGSPPLQKDSGSTDSLMCSLAIRGTQCTIAGNPTTITWAFMLPMG